jgi:choline-sulfatase
MLNILWIQTDEQRADSLGCYGNPRVRTPHLDTLAARGTVFLNHHTQSPVCVPSRVSELTSRYPHQTGILNNAGHYTWGRWPEGMVAFPELFAGAGYVTVNLGKYHTPHHPTWLENWHFEWFPGEAGFTSLAPGFDEAEHEVIHLGGRPDSVILSGRYPEVAQGRTPQSHLVDQALDWLGMYAHVRRPFLMRVSFLAPHTPVLAPEPFYSMYDPADMDWDVPTADLLASRPRYEIPDGGGEHGAYHAHTDAEYRRMRCSYYGLVSHVDQQVGRLLEGLARLGLLEHTLVVYTSDHGDLMGEYGQFQKGMFYDITTRVPCIIAGPGVEAGSRQGGLTESVDLAPTLLRVAGLPVLDEMVGRDLFRDPPRPDVIGEILRSRGGVQVRRSWIRTARWSLDVSTEIDGTPASRELRDGKLVDLLADPLEHVNLYHSPAYAGVVGELEARLDERTREGRVPSPGVTN